MTRLPGPERPTDDDIKTVEPIRMSSLTLNELSYFERRAGISLAKFGDDDTPLAGPLSVFAGLALARAFAYPTREAAMAAAEHLTMEQAERLMSTDKEPTAGE